MNANDEPILKQTPALGDAEAQHIEHAGRFMERLPDLALVAFGLALLGGALLSMVAHRGLLWLVYVGTCFLIPFGGFAGLLLVQIVVMLAWAFSADYRHKMVKKDDKQAEPNGSSSFSMFE